MAPEAYLRVVRVDAFDRYNTALRIAADGCRPPRARVPSDRGARAGRPIPRPARALAAASSISGRAAPRLLPLLAARAASPPPSRPTRPIRAARRRGRAGARAVGSKETCAGTPIPRCAPASRWQFAELRRCGAATARRASGFADLACGRRARPQDSSCSSRGPRGRGCEVEEARVNRARMPRCARRRRSRAGPARAARRAQSGARLHRPRRGRRAYDYRSSRSSHDRVGNEEPRWARPDRAFCAPARCRRRSRAFIGLAVATAPMCTIRAARSRGGAWARLPSASRSRARFAPDPASRQRGRGLDAPSLGLRGRACGRDHRAAQVASGSRVPQPAAPSSISCRTSMRGSPRVSRLSLRSRSRACRRDRGVARGARPDLASARLRCAGADLGRTTTRGSPRSRV